MQGFEMLRPERGGDAHCGPFFAESSLVPVVEELAQIAITAAQVFTRFFSIKTRMDAATKLGFTEQSGLWFERFFSRPYDSKPVDELKTRAASLPE
jgi:hypothetical protein